jgi:hypothetical protein
MHLLPRTVPLLGREMFKIVPTSCITPLLHCFIASLLQAWFWVGTTAPVQRAPATTFSEQYAACLASAASMPLSCHLGGDLLW